MKNITKSLLPILVTLASQVSGVDQPATQEGVPAATHTRKAPKAGQGCCFSLCGGRSRGSASTPAGVELAVPEAGLEREGTDELLCQPVSSEEGSETTAEVLSVPSPEAAPATEVDPLSALNQAIEVLTSQTDKLPGLTKSLHSMQEDLKAKDADYNAQQTQLQANLTTFKQGNAAFRTQLISSGQSQELLQLFNQESLEKENDECTKITAVQAQKAPILSRLVLVQGSLLSLRHEKNNFLDVLNNELIAKAQDNTSTVLQLFLNDKQSLSPMFEKILPFLQPKLKSINEEIADTNSQIKNATPSQVDSQSTALDITYLRQNQFSAELQARLSQADTPAPVSDSQSNLVELESKLKTQQENRDALLTDIRALTELLSNKTATLSEVIAEAEALMTEREATAADTRDDQTSTQG